MPTGTVKFFNETKGYGFIQEDGSGNELFVHVSGIQDKIMPNDKVSYILQDTPKGPSAINVTKIQ